MPHPKKFSCRVEYLNLSAIEVEIIMPYPNNFSCRVGYLNLLAIEGL